MRLRTPFSRTICWRSRVVAGSSMSRPLVTGWASQRYSSVTSDEPDLTRGKHRHAQQQPAVGPPTNVGRAIRPLAIAYRQFDNPQSELGGTEQQIEISKRIEVAKIRATSRDLLVMLAAKHFRAAQRVLHRLAKQIRKGQRKEFVANDIGKAHRLPLHRVDQ